jgi:hypothetical protein
MCEGWVFRCQKLRTLVLLLPPRFFLLSTIFLLLDADALATWFEARTIKEAHEFIFVGGRQTETETVAALAQPELRRHILIQDAAAAVQAVDTNIVTPAVRPRKGRGGQHPPERPRLRIRWPLRRPPTRPVHNGLASQPQ